MQMLQIGVEVLEMPIQYSAFAEEITIFWTIWLPNLVFQLTVGQILTVSWTIGTNGFLSYYDKQYQSEHYTDQIYLLG